MARKNTQAALVLLLSATAGPVAQSGIVLPPSHAGRDGTGATNVPLGRSTPMRVQMVYDGLMFPAAGTVRQLALRLDGGATARAKKVDLEVRMSTMPHGLTFVQTRFARNVGSDEVVAIARATIALPAMSKASTPSPFHVALPLSRGFAYDPSRGPLLIELRVFGQQPGAFPLDATFVCDSPRAAFGPPGCGPTGRALRTDLLTTQVMWGRPFSVRVGNARPGAKTLLMFGTFEAGTWLGLKIPADLGPFGAPGCHLSLDARSVQMLGANGAGQAVYRFNIPSLPLLQGGWIRYQGAAIDAAHNPLGVVTSNAGKVQVCGWEPVARVFAARATSEDGLRELGVAPVVRIDLR